MKFLFELAELEADPSRSLSAHEAASNIPMMLSRGCRQWQDAVPFLRARSGGGQQPSPSWAMLGRYQSTKLRVAEHVPPQPIKKPPIIVSPSVTVSEKLRKGVAIDRQDPKPDAGRQASDRQALALAPAPAPAPAPAMTNKLERTRGKTSVAKMKQLMKEYGPVALALHSTVFASTLGSFYTLLHYGVDVATLVQQVPMLTEHMPHVGAGTLAVAWGLTAITGPARTIVTITCTRKLARLWRDRSGVKKLEEIRARAKVKTHARTHDERKEETR